MITQTNEFAGGCACNYVRYKMKIRPLVVHGCHCRLCQQQSGASFAVNALVEANQIELTKGEVVEVVVATPSGNGQSVSRCPKCQIAVWSNYLIFGGILGRHVHFIKVGTLDEPEQFPPDVHIYTSTKQPWVVLPPHTPAYAEYYETQEIWSQESLKRRSHLLGVVERETCGK